jgi:hypothetical protein
MSTTMNECNYEDSKEEDKLWKSCSFSGGYSGNKGIDVFLIMRRSRLSQTARLILDEIKQFELVSVL